MKMKAKSTEKSILGHFGRPRPFWGSIRTRLGQFLDAQIPSQSRSWGAPGEPRAATSHPKACPPRPKDAPRDSGQLPRRSHRCSRRTTESEALADRFLIDFQSTRGSSKVRFVSLLQVFCRCRTFCAPNACRVQQPRKNNRFGLQNRGLGRPGDPLASKFESQNGQVRGASEVPAGPANIF